MQYTEQELKNIESIRKILMQGFQQGDTTVIDEVVHDDYIDHYVTPEINNKAGFKEIVKMVNGAFSQFDELNLKPEVIFAKSDFVAMMDTGGGKKNGKEYRHVDIHIFRFENGLLREHWNSFNLPVQREVLMQFLQESN